MINVLKYLHVKPKLGFASRILKSPTMKAVGAAGITAGLMDVAMSGGAVAAAHLDTKNQIAKAMRQRRLRSR